MDSDCDKAEIDGRKRTKINARDFVEGGAGTRLWPMSSRASKRSTLVGKKTMLQQTMREAERELADQAARGHL